MSQIQDKGDDNESEFLTPEQRFEIVADTLATIALRIVKQNHEEEPLS